MSDQRGSDQPGPEPFVVPTARLLDLVTTETAEDLIVYDKRTHHIHHLNRTSAAVWRACNGRRTNVEVAHAASEALKDDIDQATLRLALTKLDDADLLQAPLPRGLRVHSHTRRGFVRKAAAGGAIALPMIVSMTAPTAAQTMSQPDPVCSQLYEPCVTDTSCCPGLRCEAWVYNPNLGTLPYGCVQV